MCYSLRKKVNCQEDYTFLKSFLCVVHSILVHHNSSCYCWQKNLDFKLKIVGGDISSIPGVSDAIEVNQTYLIFLALVGTSNFCSIS